MLGAISPPITTGPDAELLAILAKFDALTQAFEEIMVRPGEAHPHQAEIDEIETAQGRLLDKICELQAMTLEGFNARARTLARFEPGLFRLVESETDPVEKMVAALVRDLIVDAPAKALEPA